MKVADVRIPRHHQPKAAAVSKRGRPGRVRVCQRGRPRWAGRGLRCVNRANGRNGVRKRGISPWSEARSATAALTATATGSGSPTAAPRWPARRATRRRRLRPGLGQAQALPGP